MKITEWPSKEDFIYKECMIGGEKCYLITPQHIGCRWTEDNLIFRSSIWTENGRPVSLGFKKFFNYGEAPHIVPDPTDLDGIAVEKIDGSLLIVSQYNGELVVRTRGTVDASKLDNGFEIDYLKAKYPRAFNNAWVRSEVLSVLYEWTTPNNRIVLDYGNEPQLFLVGMVQNFSYGYRDQRYLDDVAEHLGILRPRKFAFNSLSEMLESVKELKNEEGICYYFNYEQDIKKIKSLDYLAKHRFKSNVSDENIVDLFLELECPDAISFFKHIMDTFDFEVANFSNEYITKVCNAYATYQAVFAKVYSLYLRVKDYSRKDAARVIQEELQPYIRFMCFSFLDGKEIKKETIKKLLLHYMAR
jgi:hypothetical protein